MPLAEEARDGPAPHSGSFLLLAAPRGNAGTAAYSLPKRGQALRKTELRSPFRCLIDSSSRTHSPEEAFSFSNTRARTHARAHRYESRPPSEGIRWPSRVAFRIRRTRELRKEKERARRSRRRASPAEPLRV